MFLSVFSFKDVASEKLSVHTLLQSSLFRIELRNRIGLFMKQELSYKSIHSFDGLPLSMIWVVNLAP